MEPNSVIHSDANQGNLFLLYIQGNTATMSCSLVLLFSFFQVLSVGKGAPHMSSSAPMEEELIKVKVEVENYADTLIVRLTQFFQTPPTLILSPPTTELGGLSSIVAVLEGYNNLISDSLDDVAQLKNEISLLVDCINKWNLMHCGEQQTKPQVPEPLQRLQNRIRFIHTVSIEALMRLKEFLSVLRINLDHLETC